jgi:hypothetical protein
MKISTHFLVFTIYFCLSGDLNFLAAQFSPPNSPPRKGEAVSCTLCARPAPRGYSRQSLRSIQSLVHTTESVIQSYAHAKQRPDRNMHVRLGPQLDYDLRRLELNMQACTCTPQGEATLASAHTVTPPKSPATPPLSIWLPAHGSSKYSSFFLTQPSLFVTSNLVSSLLIHA